MRRRAACCHASWQRCDSLQVDAFKGRIARLAADLGRNRLPQLPQGAPPEAVLEVRKSRIASVGASRDRQLHIARCLDTL